MEFMDKRLSKNFHMRRYHQQVVQENLKILRALEEIHSRSSTAAAVGTDNSVTGGGEASLSGEGGRGTSTAPVSTKRSKGLLSASTANTGRSPSRKKLKSLLARKRNVKAALVARENQKMMEVSVIFVPSVPCTSYSHTLSAWKNTFFTGNSLPTVQQVELNYILKAMSARSTVVVHVLLIADAQNHTVPAKSAGG